MTYSNAIVRLDEFHASQEQDLIEASELESLVGQAVEECCLAIAQGISGYINHTQEFVSLYVNQILAGEMECNRQTLLTELIREESLLALLDELKSQVQHRLRNALGVTSMEISGMDIDWREALDGVSCIRELYRQRRVTLQMMQFSQVLADQAWDLAVDKLLPAPLERLLPDFTGGRLFFLTAGVDADKEVEATVRQLRQGIAGLLENVRLRIIRAMSRKTASVFYSILDARK